MSAPIDDGGSAFPVVGGTKYDGMTLRDYFAGLALQGGLASTETLRQAAMVVLQSGERTTLEQMLAIRSYAFADAMLEARKGVQS